MPQQLTRRKCEKILRFYKKPLGRSESLVAVRNKTKAILREKMCRCVNALYKGTPSSEPSELRPYSDSVAICKRSVYTRKGLTPPKFTCRLRPKK